MSRTLPVEGLVNGRDLGGLVRRDGATTPAKRPEWLATRSVDLDGLGNDALG